MNDLTLILNRLEQGDRTAADELLPLVYNELRQMASRKMAGEPQGHTLQPTALVHEAWLRLGADAQPHWQSRAHFFGAAGEAMRRILVERARRRLGAKRGGRLEPVELDKIELPAPIPDADALLRVNEALEKLAAVDPRKAELVKLRYFVGMTFEETAAVLWDYGAGSQAVVGLCPRLAFGRAGQFKTDVARIVVAADVRTFSLVNSLEESSRRRLRARRRSELAAPVRSHTFPSPIAHV